MLDLINKITRITLDPSDMYSDGRQVIFNSGEGKLLRDKAAYTGKEGDTYYTVKYGELITSIAYRHYKNKVERPSRYWYVIADANNIINPLDLTSLVGTEILIPDIIAYSLTKK